MEPYIPPRRVKNPGTPPGAVPGGPNLHVVPNPGTPPVNNPTAEEAESWITKHPILFLLFSATVTAAIGGVVTHVVGSYMRRREEQARLQGELVEAQVLGVEPEVVTNPEVTVEDRLGGLEERMINLGRHFGVPG